MQGDSHWGYIKQPHIIVISILLCVAVAFAIYSGIQRLSEKQRIASLDTYSACREFIDDKALCRFAEKESQNTKTHYVIASTTTSEESTEISTLEVESEDRMKSVTYSGPRETEAFIILDSISYVKDYSDGVWAMYDDPAFEPSKAITDLYDFSSAQASSTTEFRDYYVREGTEACGELTCYKYRINSNDGTSITSYIWFDDTEYLLRRHMVVTSDKTTNNQFTYQTVTITPPSPTKTVTEEEFSSFLEG